MSQILEDISEHAAAETVVAKANTHSLSPQVNEQQPISVRFRIPDPGEVGPALPDEIPDPELGFDQLQPLGPGAPQQITGPFIPIPHFRSLRQGCYLLRYKPRLTSPTLFPLHYDGTLRVERSGPTTIASGDLYRHTAVPTVTLPIPFEPSPSAGIPIFPRATYSYYVRVTNILQTITLGSSFALGFELHRFTAATSSWTNEGTFTAHMSWVVAPAGYPSSGDYMTGNVKNSTGAVVGNLSMGWVATYLRRATIEIDRVPVSEWPLNNASGVDWRTIFDQVGWDVTVRTSNSDVAEPSGESWSDAEMHAAMLSRRDSANLDVEWRYHILCVRRLDSTERGIMYDIGATDSNHVAREGVGIASHWMIPDTPTWGLVRGKRSGLASAPYFRTAVHESGHAMGLYHNTVDMGIMNTTDVISASAVPPVQFPNNIQWSHAPDDRKRLRHMPDIWTRPGGIPFGSAYGSAPISPGDLISDAEGLILSAEPLRESVPLGAPVRVNFTLRNKSVQPIPAPPSLSLRTGFVSGKVVDPSGTIRSFKPLIRCVEEHNLALLAPGGEVSNSVTLLRGAQGALFPAGGAYRVVIDVDWEYGGVQTGLTAETSVLIKGAHDDDHAQAALKILSSPDALLTLILGGDHLPEGVEAIRAGVENAVLRPHFAMSEAKRVGTRFFSRKPDYKKAAELLRDAVMTPAEMERAADMISANGDQMGRSKHELVSKLQTDAEEVGVNDRIREKIRSLNGKRKE